MGITIGAEPDSSFEDPLGLLSDCHRRIEKFLQMLIGVVAESRDALSQEQRDTLDISLRYFRKAAPRHTLDEEESLFPKLRACEGAAAALAAIDALEADHDIADEGHAEVDRLGRQWLADGRLSQVETAKMHEALRRLQSLYGKHIKIEDNQIFPLAGRVLDAPTIRAVGREMAQRRGLDIDSMPNLKLRCPKRRAAAQE